MNIGQIVAEITATTTGLRRAQQDANKQFGQIQNEATATSKVVKTAFAVAAVAAVAAFTKELYKCYQGANDTKKAMLGLESTTKAFGQNFEDANKSVKELYSDGLMPLDKSIRGFKNLLSVGFSVDEAMQLSKSLKDIGAFNNVVGDLGQAYEDSTKGLKTGSMELIENIGLTQRLSAVMKAANIDISNGIDITNDAAQRRAVYNAILAEGAKFEGNAAKLANDNAAASAKLSAAWKELSDNLGNRASPAFSGVLGLITQLTKATSEIFKRNRIDEANEYADSVRKQKENFDELSITYTRLAANQNKTAEETKVYKDTIAELKKLYPDFLEKIDMEKEGYEGVAEALIKINEQLNKKLLFSMKEKEMAVQQQKIIDADLKKYEATVKQNEALSKQQALINQLSKKKETLQAGRYVTNSEGNKEFVKFTAEDAKKDSEIKNINGTYMKKMLAAEDEYALSTERRRLSNMKVTFAKEIAEYDLQKKQATQEIIKINKKYDTISGYNPIEDEKKKAEAEAKAKAKAKAEAEKKAEPKAKTKAEAGFKPDMEKTLAQKKAELEYKMQADLVNAKKEEENIIKLKYASQAKILEIEDTFAKEVAGAKTQKQVEDAYDKMIKAIGEEELALKVSINFEEGKEAVMQEAANALADEYNNQINAMVTEFLNKLKKAESAVGLTDVSNYGVPKPEPVVDNTKETEQAFKDLDAALKNMIDVIDNDVITALYSLGEGGKSFINSFKGFQAGQSEGELLGGLGMLTGGIGMFTSAVSIFQGVGGLFHKSTYNFEEAVKKMEEKIGDMTPEEQLAQVKEARYLEVVEATWEKAVGPNSIYGLTNKQKAFIEAAKRIIPSLSEALGTSVEDFRQDFSSVLGDSSNYSDMEDALYNSVFSSVKQGLINAYLLNEPMLALTERLRDTVTESVADGILTAEEKAQIEEITGEVNQSLEPFIESMEAVGLDLIDASDSLADATDNFSSTMNRNLKLAERISKDSLGNSQIINIDLAGANLGGMNEANIVNSLNKAVAMSNIAKVGVR